MSRVTGDVLLLGSVPLQTVQAVFETCALALDGHLSGLPDGEIGYRSSWIMCQAWFVFRVHPQLEVMNRPAPIDGKEQWKPRNLTDDNWQFKIEAGAGDLKFEDLKYASWAIDSYATFKQLRDRGRIATGIRFQVSLPIPIVACGEFFSPDGVARVDRPYEAAMLEEVRKICEAIPHRDLAIQWDVTLPGRVERGVPLRTGANAFQRWLDDVQVIGPSVPADVLLGYHLCYGDFNHTRAVQPRDLSASVRMLNAAVTRSGRPVDFAHMTVPIDRTDDAYFAPLRDLRIDGTRVFLGLVHFHDGVKGTVARVRAARRYLEDFGVATECGLGRRQPETLPKLLKIHRDVAERLRDL
jgi:hypothetical protein